MPRIPNNNLGQVGIVTDLDPHLLQANVWSEGKNVRFRENAVEKFKGHSVVFGGANNRPNDVFYWAQFYRSITSNWWIFGSATKLYGLDVASLTYYDVTRTVGGNYTTGLNNRWVGGFLGGIPVFTNNNDDPQAWLSPGTGTDFEDLPNWPANTTCYVMRPFGNFLVAGRINKSGTTFPHLVKWSSPAAPGAVPPSWDETDPTERAGELELPDAEAGSIRDMMVLGNRLLIYKENSVHAMTFIGGNDVFSIDQLDLNFGILNKHCVSPVLLSRSDGRHFVATADDLVIHNGITHESILDRRYQKFLRRTISTDHYRRSFVVANHTTREAWFCYPEPGATEPTLAIVWNWRENTINTRELQSFNHIAGGLLSDTIDTTWNNDSEAWDDDQEPWDSDFFSASTQELLACPTTPTQTVYQLDRGETANGTPFLSYVGRDNLGIIATGRDGEPIIDLTSKRLITRLWIYAEGGPIDVRIGSKTGLHSATTWSQKKSFDPSTQKYLDFTIDTTVFAIRFETKADVTWKLHGYDIELEATSELVGE